MPRRPICKGAIQVALVVKQPDALGAFSAFHNELERPSIEPSLALLDQTLHDLFGKAAGVFLAELELHIRLRWRAICTTSLASSGMSVKPSPHSMRVKPSSAQRSK